MRDGGLGPLGFDYVESGHLLMLPPEAWLDRVIALDKPELRNDAAARAAVLGTQPRPSFQLSKLFEEYDGLVKDETKKFSPSQIRIWRNSRVRVVKELVDVVGDKPVTRHRRWPPTRQRRRMPNMLLIGVRWRLTAVGCGSELLP
ncbi:hypothetical protein [Bradyrhizobium sp. 169]|uniref:hypothetical protein n=1 Tax=Bradyrhizobium sp. 169 TaxID=2782640 RepID=UPI001FF9B5E9|nr:hypothetical protein [Bradyrhizobium sp. 169]MCK1590215.1 hypothetical protein [Bradyrhizobium sp. 169]